LVIEQLVRPLTSGLTWHGYLGPGHVQGGPIYLTLVYGNFRNCWNTL
jgi:hypothetical protein